MKGVAAMTTVSVETWLSMRHLENAMKNLKQHFYNLKHIEMKEAIQ